MSSLIVAANLDLMMLEIAIEQVSSDIVVRSKSGDQSKYAQEVLVTNMWYVFRNSKEHSEKKNDIHL